MKSSRRAFKSSFAVARFFLEPTEKELYIRLLEKLEAERCSDRSLRLFAKCFDKQYRAFPCFLVEIIREVFVAHFLYESFIYRFHAAACDYVPACYAVVVFPYIIQAFFAACVGLVANIIRACPACSASTGGKDSLSCLIVAL